MSFDNLKIIWIGRFKYKPGWKVDKHIHTFFHMFYIAGGKGILIIKNEKHLLECGQIFICPPRYEHEFTSDEINPLKTIEVKFSLTDERLLHTLINVSNNINIDMTNIKDFLEDSINEALTKDYLYTEKIKTDIYTILLRIVRQHKHEISKDQSFSKSPLTDYNYEGINFKTMLLYIANNLDKRINLDGLSKLAGVNSTYLCRIFKEKYGTSPMHYINNMRLKKAKELLSFSELNVTQIADSLGFQTIHYFSRFFKNKEKMSPLEYREKMNNSIFLELDGN